MGATFVAAGGRLGTVIHDDLQKALIYYNNINKESIKNKEKEIKNKQKEKFHGEGNVEIPELNVRGHYDVVLEGEKVYLFDFKTASSWSNSSLVCAAVIVSPSVYDDCRVYVAPIYLLAPT